MCPQSPQREFALEIVQRLRAAGHEALWAGGCVRDQLLGLQPKDYDVATSARPDDIRAIFGQRRTLAIGAAFGVVTVLGPRSGDRRGAKQIDVATFRRDAAYSDGRHPDSVTFTNAQEDASRRDFTINGLFFDPLANEIVDYVGGRADLERKLIRAIGDPRLRIREDKLRMLRAVRFAASFGFQIDSQTLVAIQQAASEIHTVSPERIGVEIRRMLTDPNRVVAIELLRETNLLSAVLPEVAALDEPAWRETLRLLGGLRDPELPLALAALLSQTTGRPIVGPVGRRLRYTNKEIERAEWLLAHHAEVADAPQRPWPRLQRILVHEAATDLLALREAEHGPNDLPLLYCRERMAWPAERINPPPLLTGADLIAHGLAPSPHFARLLEAARDAQLNCEVTTTAEALALVDRISAQGLDDHAR